VTVTENLAVEKWNSTHFIRWVSSRSQRWNLDYQLTWVVAPFLHAPNVSLGQAINGTTSNEEIPTAKFSDVTLHKRVPLFLVLNIYLIYKYIGIYIGIQNYIWKFNWEI